MAIACHDSVSVERRSTVYHKQVSSQSIRCVLPEGEEELAVMFLWLYESIAVLQSRHKPLHNVLTGLALLIVTSVVKGIILWPVQCNTTWPVLYTPLFVQLHVDFLQDNQFGAIQTLTCTPLGQLGSLDTRGTGSWQESVKCIWSQRQTRHRDCGELKEIE